MRTDSLQRSVEPIGTNLSRQFLWKQAGLPVRVGGIGALEQAVSAAWAAPVIEAERYGQRQPVRDADETSWREPGGEPTHKSAARPFRSAVLWRRRSIGTPREAGSQFVERILTAVTTLRQQHRDVLASLTAACAAAICNIPAPSLLPLTPPPPVAR